MRKLAFAAIALIAIFTNATSIFGQSYPWSAQSTPAVTNRNATSTVPSISNPYQDEQRSQQAVPQAPSMQPKPFLASMRKQTEAAAQPSPPEAVGFELGNPPGQAPPNANGAYQNVVSEQNPELGVQSTAGQQPNYCCRGCTQHTCDLGCIKRIFGQTPGGFEIAGWGSFGYTNRNDIVFNDRKGTINAQQVYLYAQKEAERSCDWNLGFRTDLVYGLDAQKAQAFGNPPTGNPSAWDNSWDYGAFGWALPQAYVQFANCDWDVTVGKFFAPMGYEKFESPQNFFYSHSFAFRYMQPRTLSGIIGKKQVRDNATVHFGASVGWDSAFEMNDDGFVLLTGFSLQPNSCVNLSASSSYGDTGYRGTGSLNTGVAEFQLTENMQYVLAGNLLNLRDNNEFGFTQYLFRDISCCLGLGARLEWWKSDQIFPDTKSTWEFTMGANYRPKANFTFRPEVRWDWGAGAIDPGATIVGIDAVLLY